MSNSKRTLADFGVSVEKIKSSFIALADKKEQLEDLKLIFNVAISDLSLFPNINMPDNESYEGYLSRRIKGYEAAMKNPPSERCASPKSSCSDPAIKTIVQYATGVDEKTSDDQSNHHNLFMSAENIQGNLLEEFINKEIRKFGWIWCNGNVLRAVVCPPSKNGHRKATKNGMNRILSFVFERRPHLFHGLLDNEPLPT